MKHIVLQEFGQAASLLAEPQLLHHFFEQQAAMRPHQLAVECNGKTMTYTELDSCANQVASYLHRRGVQGNALVALCLKKSCALYAAMLGILKAGAGYVPIDPNFPVGRIQAILADAGVAFVLSDSETQRVLDGNVPATVLDVGMILSGDPSLPAVSIIAPTDVCYVIYTSGSTGVPKGVVIEHRNAVHFVRAIRQVYGLNECDRTYQGFSIAFDASVEEIWAAFSNGGTLVVPTQDISRSTIDAADFINERTITFFSTVPSFLAMMEPGLPTLKLLVLGGEVCPPELIARWERPGQRILNTYGPTEATVVTTYCECVAGQAVTIGVPLPGYDITIRNEDGTETVPGESGELYIGGPSIARGYMNRDALTAERFVLLPAEGPHTTIRRMYRTHDLVTLTHTGALHFVGRTDSQVKIRGFRVELSEIESVLLEHQSIKAVVAKVVEQRGWKEIATYVVLRDPSLGLRHCEIVDLVRARLPEYMFPNYLDILPELPLTTSTKVDRSLLPSPISPFLPSGRVIVPAETVLERAILTVWKEVLKVGDVSVEDNFFRDLHGNSLIAGKMVTALRAELDSHRVSVRDVYAHPTVRGLAKQLEAVGVSPRAPQTFAKPGPEPKVAKLPRARHICVLFQLLSLVLYYGVVSAPLVIGVGLMRRVVAGELDWQEAVAIATPIGFAIWPTWLFLSIAIKWLVIGRFKAGRYPVWGLYYFRWWFVSRFQALSWSEMFVGTPLMSLYYQAMGAKVGRNCTIGSSVCVAFDLVSIGQNTSVGVDTHLLGYRVENGFLTLGNIDIGDNCFIGTHCCLGLNVRMRNRARLDDLSFLPDGSTIETDGARRGSPAKAVDFLLPHALQQDGARYRGLLFGLIHLGLIYAMGYLLILSLLPGFCLLSYAVYSGSAATLVIALMAVVPVSIAWYLLIVVAVKRLAVGRIAPGLYSIRSAAYLRYWFTTYLLNNTREIVLGMYATMLSPAFFRMMGAKIGRRVEVSTIMHAMPDLLEIDDESFLADSCIVGGHRVFGGYIELCSNRIGKRTFVGNSAYIPAGINLGDNALLGVMSTTPVGIESIPDESAWFGSPAFRLPTKQKFGCFSAQQTFDPSLVSIILRALHELLRILLPGFVSIAALTVFCYIVTMLSKTSPLWVTSFLASIIALPITFATLSCVAFVKKLMMGTFVPTIKPLWCSYVWLNEVVNALYESVAASAFAPMMGTPFIAPFLRLMGCKVGRWVFLETTLFSEFDMVEIGDRASLNLGSTMQTHLFEDRIMKVDRIKIGAGCTVGNMAVVLYDTEMESGSSLGPMSVLMKGERLPAHSSWYGIPCQLID